MCVYLRAKFEVYSIILTSFRQKRGGGNLSPHLLKTGGGGGGISPPPPQKVGGGGGGGGGGGKAGVVIYSPASKRTPKKTTQIWVKICLLTHHKFIMLFKLIYTCLSIYTELSPLHELFVVFEKLYLSYIDKCFRFLPLIE